MPVSPGPQLFRRDLPALFRIEGNFEGGAFVPSEQRGGELRGCHRAIPGSEQFADRTLDVNLRRIEKRHTDVSVAKEQRQFGSTQDERLNALPLHEIARDRQHAVSGFVEKNVLSKLVQILVVNEELIVIVRYHERHPRTLENIEEE